MKHLDGSYYPEGIVNGTRSCESCLDPDARTVRFTGLDNRTFDVCYGCLDKGMRLAHSWYPEPQGPTW